MKVLERAAILVLAVFWVVAAALADDTKPHLADGSASAGATAAGAPSANDSSAKTATAATGKTARLK